MLSNKSKQEFNLKIENNKINVLKRNKYFYRALKDFCFNHLKKSKNLSNSESALIYHLIDISNIYKYGFLLSNKKISKHLSLSERQISRIIKKLIDKDLLKGTYKTRQESINYFTSRLLEINETLFEEIIKYQSLKNDNAITKGLYNTETTKQKDYNNKEFIEFLIKEQITAQINKKRKQKYYKGFTIEELKTAFYRIKEILINKKLLPHNA